MINEEKVKIMTQMAISDKYHTPKDKRITAYYPEDYVYLNNFKTRIMILVLVGVGIVGHILIRINNGTNMPTTMSEICLGYIVPYGTFLLVALLFYTIISTLRARKQYRDAARRIESYHALSERLEVFEKEQGEKYGTKRKHTHYERKSHSVL